MDRSRKERNIKQIVNARFMNPKFVYDGKRMQPVYDRKVYDYASSVVYERGHPSIPWLSDPRYNLKSQILGIRQPGIAGTEEGLPCRFLHMCINKVRSPVNTIQWNPDGRRLLSGSTSGEITMWNSFAFNFDTILQAHESPLRAMAWSPSDSFLVSGDNNGIIKYWHPSMSNLQLIEAHAEPIKDLSFSCSDAKFCSASDDGLVKVWDSITSRPDIELRGHNWDVRKAQWHPKYALIASGGKDNLVKLWDPRVEQAIGTFHYHKNTILALHWYKDDWLLTGGKDQVVKRFDLRTMTEAFVYKSINRDISAIAVHPFLRVFSTGSGDGSVIHWHETGDVPIFESDNKHSNTVWALDYHPAGHLLASGSADCMVKFWGRRRPIDFVKEHAPPHSVFAESYKHDEGMPIPGLGGLSDDSEQ